MKFSAGEAEKGVRVDAWLAYLARVSRSRAVSALESGAITLNGKTVRPSHHLKAGDILEGEMPAAPDTTVGPEPGKIPIAFQDSHLVVVDKPAGLAVHPGAGLRSGTLVNMLLGMGLPLAPAGGRLRPGVVHRLDKDTSGLLVLALSDTAFWALSKMVAAHEFDREYLALVFGHPVPASGTIDAPLGRDPRDRERFAVVQNGGRRAVTRYETVESFGEASLLRVRLETGRTHQIRVHLSAMGWPVLGDRLYGGRNRAPKAIALPARQALHAAKLGFIHPVTGKKLGFESPLPADLKAVVKAMGGGIPRRNKGKISR